MADESLELRLNMNRKFLSATPEAGMLVAHVPPEERARYLAGTFKELVQYALDNVLESSQREQLSQEEKNTYNSIVGKIENEVGNSRVRVKLYDKDFGRIQVSGDQQAEIYLSDTVSNRVDGDIDYLGIGIDTSPGVG